MRRSIRQLCVGPLLERRTKKTVILTVLTCGPHSPKDESARVGEPPRFLSVFRRDVFGNFSPEPGNDKAIDLAVSYTPKGLKP